MRSIPRQILIFLCRYLRRSIIENMYKKTQPCGDNADIYRYRGVVNSYLGMLKHVNSYKERLKFARNRTATPFSTNDGLNAAYGKYYMSSTESGNTPANNAYYVGMANDVQYGGYNNKNQSTAFGLIVRAVRKI